MVGCGRHGGERPNLPGRVRASAIVEGRLLQSEAFFVSKVLKSISFLYQQKFRADVRTATVESAKGFV